MENKKIIAALKKAFKKVYGVDDFFFILGAYTKDPGIFPKPAAELLKKIKADLMNELFEDYCKTKKIELEVE